MSVDPGRSRKGVTYIPALSVADCPIDGNNLNVGTHEDDQHVNHNHQSDIQLEVGKHYLDYLGSQAVRSA